MSATGRPEREYRSAQREGTAATAKVKVASAPLTYAQTRWLAALLLCAQVPLWGEVLTWVAFAGTGLVVVRLLPALQTGGGKWRRWALPVLALGAALGLR